MSERDHATTPINEQTLTAYALNELDGAARLAMAAYVARDPAARDFVRDVRDTARNLEAAFTREPADALSRVQHAALERRLGEFAAISLRPLRHRRWNRVVLAGSLAASVLIVCGMLALLMPRLSAPQPVAQNAEPSGRGVPFIIRQPLPPVDPALPHIDPGSGPALVIHAPREIDNPPEWLLPDRGFEPPQLAHADGGAAESAAPGTHTESNSNPTPNRPIHLAQKAEPSLPLEANAPQSHAPGGGVFSFADPSRSHPQASVSVPAAEKRVENSFVPTSAKPVSDLPVNLGTASCANLRRSLQHGQSPLRDCVRIEQMLNEYAEPRIPQNGDAPLAAETEISVCPWNPAHRLARITIAAAPLSPVARPPVNLVLVIDMADAPSAGDRLAITRTAMKSLAAALTPRDRIAIVTPAAGLSLPPTSGAGIQAISAAIERLAGGGLASGGEVMDWGCQCAQSSLAGGGVNRIILLTDAERRGAGGIRPGALPAGVSLEVVGVNVASARAMQIQSASDQAKTGCLFADTASDLKRKLIEQVDGSLIATARDVEARVSFNPELVASYRLIGNDRRIEKAPLPAASPPPDLGAGQGVTALYELVLPNRPAASTSEPLFTLIVKFKGAGGRPDDSRCLIAAGIDRHLPLANVSKEFRLAAGIAEAGLVLQDSDYKGGSTLASALDLISGRDDDGRRTELIDLLRRATALGVP